MNAILIPFESLPYIQSLPIPLNNRQDVVELAFIRPPWLSKLSIFDDEETEKIACVKLKFRRKHPAPMHKDTWEYVLDWDDLFIQLTGKPLKRAYRKKRKNHETKTPTQL